LSHELEPLIEAPQDVQHQCAVVEGFTKISEGVSHALHLAAVVINGEIALREVAEFSIKEQFPGLTVPQELLLNPEPSHPSSDTVVLVDDVEEVGGDAVEDPGDDHAVHAVPDRVGGAGIVAEDMVLQGVPTKSKEKVAAPLGVVGGLEVEDDGDQVLDVLDGAGLAVQVRNSSSLRGDRVLVVVVGFIVVDGLQTKSLPDGSRLRLQGVGLCALLGQGVGSSTDALLGGSGGLEKVRLLLELDGALGVGRSSGGGFFLEPQGGRGGIVAQQGRVGGSSSGCGSRGAGAGGASERRRCGG